MVDSLAPGVARGWRGFRHGGGYRGGKRGPSTLQRRAPREVGREKRGPREKRAEGSRSDEVAGKSGPAADPGPPKSKFTIVCSLWLRYSFSVYPFFGPFLVFLSSSLTLCFVHSLPDRAFPLSFLSSLLSNFFSFCFSFSVSRVGSPANRAGTSCDKRRAPDADNGKKSRGSTRSFRIAALCLG